MIECNFVTMKFSIKKHKNPIIKPGISAFRFFDWDSLWAYHPCAIVEKKKYYLFYTGKTIGQGIRHNVGLAVSEDLQSWEKVKAPILPVGETGEWDSDFIAHCFVFKEGAKFYMLYDGSPKGKWLEEIGLAESSDLYTWKKYDKNPVFKVGKNAWENTHVSRCCVFRENDTYYLFYAGHDGKRERIGMAKGESIFTIKRFMDKPVLDVGREGEWDEQTISDPRVMRYKNMYLMFYSGVDRNSNEQMGVAVSRDLKTWKKYDKNPILAIDPQGRDKVSAARSDVKMINDKLYIFYSGKTNILYSIGLASMSIT